MTALRQRKGSRGKEPPLGAEFQSQQSNCCTNHHPEKILHGEWPVHPADFHTWLLGQRQRAPVTAQRALWHWGGWAWLAAIHLAEALLSRIQLQGHALWAWPWPLTLALTSDLLRVHTWREALSGVLSCKLHRFHNSHTWSALTHTLRGYEVAELKFFFFLGFSEII